MRRKILLDMDGVLSDFVHGAALFHKQDPSLVTCYDIAECWNIPATDFWDPLGYDFWANLPLTAEAYNIVQMCEDAVGHTNVGILTAPCHTNGCTDGKRDWIARHFPQFKKRMFISSAKHFLAAPHLLLVDDTEEKVTSFRDEGGSAFLYPRPWNNHKHLTVVAMPELQRTLSFFTEKW